MHAVAYVDRLTQYRVGKLAAPGPSTTPTPTPSPSTTPTAGPSTTPGATPATTPTASTTPAPLPTLTLANVAVHKTAQDCWSVLYDLVYDLTLFAKIHPAGGSMFVCGGDSTKSFR